MPTYLQKMADDTPDMPSYSRITRISLYTLGWTALLFWCHEVLPRVADNRVVPNCMVSYIHCILCFYSTTRMIGRQNYDSMPVLLEKSLGYYIYDTLYMLCFNLNLIYLLHHGFCITTWTLILRYDVGYGIACSLLWVAEISNIVRIPFQCIQYIHATIPRVHVAQAWIQHIYSVLFFMNCVVYTLIRGILYPCITYTIKPAMMSLPSPKKINCILYYGFCIFAWTGFFLLPVEWGWIGA